VKAENLLFSIVLLTACVPPDDESPPMAPEPIGDELLSFTAQTDFLGCGEAHLYRARRSIQLQCISTTRDAFSWENHGTLSPEGEAALDGRSFTYSPACPTMGIAELHEVAETLVGDISDCIELDLLDGVEQGCRAY
jgi:hypothetical protein